MPVGLFRGFHGPNQVRPTQARGDVWIGGDVLLIVKNDERMAGDRPVKRHCAQRQHEANEGEIFLPEGRGGSFRA